MPPDSTPDTLAASVPAKRGSKIFWYLLLAVEVLIMLSLKGSLWASQLQMRAELLGVHWAVLVLAWLVGVPMTFLLAVFVHEGGHVLGGRLARFRIAAFVVSWLQVSRRAEGWHIRFVKPQAALGGRVLAIPTHARNLRSRYGLFVAGGPGANLLTGALALGLRHYLVANYAGPLAASLAGYVLLNGLMGFGWLSVVIGGFNLLPLNLKSGHIIDGRRLWQLLRGGPAMHQQVGLLYFQSLMHDGVRPRDWDATLVAQFTAHHSNSVLDCYAQLLVYSYFLDCNDLEQLRFHLNRSLDSVASAPPSVQQHVMGEAAFVAALLTHDPEQARHWLNQAQAAKPFTSEEGLFARAAVAYAEGQITEAEHWLELAIKQLEQCVPSGGTIQAADRLSDLQAKIEQAKHAPSVRSSQETVAA